MPLTVPLPDLIPCRECGEDKPRGAYQPSRVGRLRRGECKRITCADCCKNSEAARRRRQGMVERQFDTPEQRAEKYRQRQDDYRRSEQGQAARLRADLKRHGITPEIYDALLERQGGVCAIPGCGATSARANTSRLCVDHDHTCCPGIWSCGRCVRGLVCGPCNFTMGNGGDDPARLRALADYIEGHR